MAEPQIIICECTVRDGLQHESEFMTTERKVALIDTFSRLGFRRIEATSFSHPSYVPQFADAEEVLKRIDRREGVSYKATCVNAKAVERAVAAVVAGAGPNEISMVVSASETHQLRNTRRTHAELRREFQELAGAAMGKGLRVVGTVGTAFGCPFTGEVPLSAVEQWTGFFVDLGIDMITLGDTTGMANPRLVRERIRSLQALFPQITLIGHFHDTRGTGLANALAAVDAGVTHLDSSFGGLGGHPAKIKYAEGHTGNVVTEDLVAVLDHMGYKTGIDMEGLLEAARAVEEAVGRELHGRVTRSGLVTQRIADAS